MVSWEVEALRAQLARAQRGEEFLLQGGDCAESFEDCESDKIAKRLKILLQMSLVLLQGLKKPVIRVGRFAGQYAKPRSADTETREGVTLPCYRGDNVNRPGFSAAEREPDPDLLLRGYERASLTLNFVRALIDGGFADLHHPEYWDLDFLRHAPLRDAYQKIVDSIADSLEFFESMSGQRVHAADPRAISTPATKVCICSRNRRRRATSSGRAAGTTCPPTCRGWACAPPTSTARTSSTSAASPIPIGVKVGCRHERANGCRNWSQVLNPQNQPGRLTLIHRFGAKDIEQRLPGMIEAVRATGAQVLWVCDPMHGNTETTAGRHQDPPLRQHPGRGRGGIPHP